MDPLAEEFINVSPYNYTLNNPISNIDPDGRFTLQEQAAVDFARMLQNQLDGPGDEFKTLNDAAKDFGKEYNGKSITNEVEYTSNFYHVQKQDGESYFTYLEPNSGAAGFVQAPDAINENGIHLLQMVIHMEQTLLIIGCTKEK